MAYPRINLRFGDACSTHKNGALWMVYDWVYCMICLLDIQDFIFLTASWLVPHYWYPYLPHVYYVPTCQVRVSRFYHSCLRLVLPPPGSLGLRPQLRAPDLSGHWPSDLSGHCRTRTAARSQWALPDFNRERQWAPPQPNCKGQILVCTAGPQLQRPDEPV